MVEAKREECRYGQYLIVSLYDVSDGQILDRTQWASSGEIVDDLVTMELPVAERHRLSHRTLWWFEGALRTFSDVCERIEVNAREQLPGLTLTDMALEKRQKTVYLNEWKQNGSGGIVNCTGTRVDYRIFPVYVRKPASASTTVPVEKQTAPPMVTAVPPRRT
jgi:hypothetical protein